MEFAGIRIMARALNIDNYYIRYKIDKDKPFIVNINNVEYKMLLKSEKL